LRPEFLFTLCDMKYLKLNKNWAVHPEAPEPDINVSNNELELSFTLQAANYQHIAEGEKGILKFTEVYTYRFGKPDKEEYLQARYRFTPSQLPWGEYYELIGSNWDKNFPDDKIVLNEPSNKKSLRHFILFFRGATFECIAEDYKFVFDDPSEDILDEKYPKAYFMHYLNMFTSNFDTPSVNNYEIYTDLYIQMESVNEFNNMKAELKTIRKNNDFHLFLKYINHSGIAKFGREQLDAMVKVIENFKL
jgi:hypothetical protein